MTAWRGVIGVEGQVTVDKRLVRPGGFYWESLPLPLQDDGDRIAGTVYNIGTVDAIWRVEGEDGRTLLYGSGTYEGELPEGGLCIAADGMELDYEEAEAGLLIATRSRIRAVYIATPAWPECVFEES